MARILPNDRLLFVGSTRSGKSTIGVYFFSQFRVQRVFVDPKGEWSIPGSVTVRDPISLADALTQYAVLRYVPTHDDPQEWDAVYMILFDHGKATGQGLYVHTDESDSVGDANRYPRGLRLIQKQGAGLGIGHGAATQRPVEIPRVLRTEATHIFLVAPAPLTDDLDTIARELRLPAAELADRLSELPPHGFIWWDRREDELTDCPPLTEAMRSSHGATAHKFDPHTAGDDADEDADRTDEAPAADEADSTG